MLSFGTKEYDWNVSIDICESLKYGSAQEAARARPAEEAAREEAARTHQAEEAAREEAAFRQDEEMATSETARDEVAGASLGPTSSGDARATTSGAAGDEEYTEGPSTRHRVTESSPNRKTRYQTSLN